MHPKEKHPPLRTLLNFYCNSNAAILPNLPLTKVPHRDLPSNPRTPTPMLGHSVAPRFPRYAVPPWRGKLGTTVGMIYKDSS